MANKTVSNLNELTTVSNRDVLLVETATETLKVTKGNLLKEVNEQLNAKSNASHTHDEYVTESELNAKGLATETFVTNKIAEASLSGGRIVTEDTSKLSKTIYKMLMGESVTINCIGDSITQGGYPSYLQSRLQLIYNNNNITVKNNGTSGQTSEQVYPSLGSKIKGEDDLIILMYGINDTSGLVQNPFATTEKHKQQMDDIVNYCTNLNKEVLIVSSTPTFGHHLWINSGSYSSLVDRRIKCMKLADEEVANKYNVGFLDMSNAYLELFDLGLEKQREVYTDECHFTNDGYKYISEIILKNKLDVVSYINSDNRDKTVQIAKSPYIITDVKQFQTGVGTLNKYITLAKDNSLGTKVIFDFYNSMQECKFSLFGKKDANGGTIQAKLDGTIIVLDFNSNHTINENEFVLSENLKHGYHRLELYTSDLVSGNVYLSHFKFVNRIKNTSEDGEVVEVNCISISLNEASKTLKVGDTASLSVAFNPSNTTNKSVTWSTNNKEVATVLNGVVTCVGVGECTITAMSANGKVATCNIIVTDNEEEAPPIVENELTPFNGKKITFNGNFGGYNHIAFTCVIDASNLVNGDKVKMVYEFDNCVNTGRAGYIFGGLSSFFASDTAVSNSLYGGACTAAEGQETTGINIIGTAGSGEVIRTLSANGGQGKYMRFTAGVVFDALPFSFRIKNLAMYVNDVQVKVLNVGGFFIEEAFTME